MSNAGKDTETLNHSDIAGGNVNGALWKTVWQFFKELTTQLPYDSAIIFLGISKKWRTMLT